MEHLIKSLSNGEILSIDLDLTIDKDCYAQTSIILAAPRCKAFYCFRNDDTREDGEERLSPESFDTICKSISKLLSNNDNEGSAPRMKYELVITTADKRKFTFKSQSETAYSSKKDCTLSAHTLKAIVNCLTDNIAEYTFLTPFCHYI